MSLTNLSAPTITIIQAKTASDYSISIRSKRQALPQRRNGTQFHDKWSELKAATIKN
jgi:hypothetical protein